MSCPVFHTGRRCAPSILGHRVPGSEYLYKKFIFYVPQLARINRRIDPNKRRQNSHDTYTELPTLRPSSSDRAWIHARGQMQAIKTLTHYSLMPGAAWGLLLNLFCTAPGNEVCKKALHYLYHIGLCSSFRRFGCPLSNSCDG